jgi:hypothetical protein
MPAVAPWLVHDDEVVRFLLRHWKRTAREEGMVYAVRFDNDSRGGMWIG